MTVLGKHFDSGTDSDSYESSSSPSLSDSSSSSDGYSGRENRDSVRNHGRRKRKRSVSASVGKDDSSTSSSSSGPSSSSSGSSDSEHYRRHVKSKRRKERRSSHGKSIREKERKRGKARESKRKDGKHRRKEKHSRKERHDRASTKRVAEEAVSSLPQKFEPSKSNLQVMTEAQQQQKELVRRNVEMAKARLASGELDRMKNEQMEMQRLYGSVDWRQKKKLRVEKSRLERTVAAGKKLAKIEERESARMDAFRVALGLPTAEAQRQAEWRAEATRALAAEAVNKDNVSPPLNRVPSRSRKVIGPRLPKR